MAFQGLRRTLLVAACAGAALLAACGGGSVESQFTPARIVVFGDGFADLGQVGGRRYTVNDGTVNVWTQQLASRYGVSLAAAASGGSSYATGSARVLAKPDAAGSASTPSVKEQIDNFLASGGLRSTDLVVVSAGTADVVAEGSLAISGAQSSGTALANVSQAGADLGAQVRRLVTAGAQHVLVVGTYNLGRSPWALASAQVGPLTDYSSRFNESFLISVVDLGKNVLYADSAFYFNLVTSSPSSYSMDNATAAVCTSVDAGAGIGIGAGQVNSALCNTSTLVGGANYNRFVFADLVYTTPEANRQFGNYAFDKIRQRW
jgi:outer membrane lipase/esterase